MHSGTSGVVVAQGGRFGGWSLYCVDGVPAYAYNFVGRDLTTVRAHEAMAPGRHDLVRALRVRRRPARQRRRGRRRGGWDGWSASGRIPVTTAYYFSFDETFNVGVDRGTPVTDDYPPVHNRFKGVIHRVRFDLAEAGDPGTGEERGRAVRVHQ